MLSRRHILLHAVVEAVRRHHWLTRCWYIWLDPHFSLADHRFSLWATLSDQPGTWQCEQKTEMSIVTCRCSGINAARRAATGICGTTVAAKRWIIQINRLLFITPAGGWSDMYTVYNEGGAHGKILKQSATLRRESQRSGFGFACCPASRHLGIVSVEATHKKL